MYTYMYSALKYTTAQRINIHKINMLSDELHRYSQHTIVLNMYSTHYKLEITYAKRSSVLRLLAVFVSQYKTRHNHLCQLNLGLTKEVPC